ncbi:MAG: F0F1 ATP synthase subunit delta [Candidatus Daviesbacteria bacterium]|nr:F0F1 ATP synthase subunit delta [Candidatus Daviesbacteria bacterium]
MKIKKQLQKTVNKLVDLSFKEGRMLETEVTRSIKILKTLSKSEAIQALSEYLKSLKRKEREHTLYIEATIPLSTIQINKVKKIVEKEKKITKVLVNINPDILGGFKLRIGDEIWDESIQGKIQQVKEAIGG